MSRAILPNRRPSWRVKFGFTRDPMTRPPMTFFGTVSFYPTTGPWLAQKHWRALDESRPYEVFIDCAKQDSDAGIQAEAAAIYASLALQHGCPLQRLVDACPKNQDGEPSEPVGAFLKLVGEGAI